MLPATPCSEFLSICPQTNGFHTWLLSRPGLRHMVGVLVDSFQYMKCHLLLTWQIVPIRTCYQMLVGSNQSMPQHLPFNPLHVFCLFWLEVCWRRRMGCVSHKAPMLNEHCLWHKGRSQGSSTLQWGTGLLPKLKISSRADVEDVQAEGEAGAATLSSAPKLLTAAHCPLLTVHYSLLSAHCSLLSAEQSLHSTVRSTLNFILLCTHWVADLGEFE